MEQCSNCQFFRKPANNNTAYGVCVRFPMEVDHNESFWCGEYKAKQENRFKEVNERAKERARGK